jgi:hypothetical protein
MAKLKPVRRKANLLDGLSDPKIMEEIGKTLDKNGRITTTIETDLIEIHSDNYMVVDTDVAYIVQKEISENDYLKLFGLGVCLKTKYNILFNHTRPFTVETLSKRLGINIDNTNKFVKRMVAKGIMAYTVCAPSGYIQKIYAINPQLIRRGKCYDKDFVLTYFRIFDDSFKEGVSVPDDVLISGIKPNTDF